MAGKIASELRARSDAAATGLRRQLEGMESHLERADAPGEWTAREVLSHLLFEPGWDPAATLRTFADRDFPLVEVVTGKPFLTADRRAMTLAQLVDALERQRRSAFAYLEGLPDTELTGRKARIPLFRQFMGTDEISMQGYVGALLDSHWKDHTGQLAKIRKAAGLPEAS